MVFSTLSRCVNITATLSLNSRTFFQNKISYSFYISNPRKLLTCFVCMDLPILDISYKFWFYSVSMAPYDWFLSHCIMIQKFACVLACCSVLCYLWLIAPTLGKCVMFCLCSLVGGNSNHFHSETMTNDAVHICCISFYVEAKRPKCF